MIDLMIYKQRITSCVKLHLSNIITTEQFNYKTFGVDVEPYIAEALTIFFESLHYNRTNMKTAKDKNEFPDFNLLDTYAIEFKSGNLF